MRGLIDSGVAGVSGRRGSRREAWMGGISAGFEASRSRWRIHDALDMVGVHDSGTTIRE